jgi:hypothetical protein
MPLETVARYRSYAADCIKIADSLPTVALKLEFLAMARVWITLANESDKNSQAVATKWTNKEATSVQRLHAPKKWKLFICNWAGSPPIEYCSECNSKGEAIERAYDLPPQCKAVRIEGPHGERIGAEALER